MQELLTSQFWLGLGAIIWVNIILSGDNAVVIALAARSLPRHQQNKAIIWGAGAAVVLRIVLTIVAVELLKLSYLKLLGGALLFWIAVKLLVPEDGGGDGVKSSSNLLAAIKTILIADLVMSLDNVIAVAAVAKGSISLLVLGLVISIPLVVFGATMLMKIMETYPVIVTVGAALIGYVSGEMLQGASRRFQRTKISDASALFIGGEIGHDCFDCRLIVRIYCLARSGIEFGRPGSGKSFGRGGADELSCTGSAGGYR
ncbi:MAG: TerC family protein [Betaproteobacteria bacterium]|nr:MAG: TerC family protein [Betaproteobacteria bacterium]